MGSFWVNEGIGFTSFSRHVSTPQETGGLEVSFPELPPNAIERLLGAIGLPFRPGMSHDEVLSACGNPERTHVFVAHRKTYDFAIGSRHAYHVSATIDDTEGLVYVVVIRKDVLSKCDA
jgi:hypothetical protein